MGMGAFTPSHILVPLLTTLWAALHHFLTHSLSFSASYVAWIDWREWNMTLIGLEDPVWRLIPDVEQHFSSSKPNSDIGINCHHNTFKPNFLWFSIIPNIPNNYIKPILICDSQLNIVSTLNINGDFFTQVLLRVSTWCGSSLTTILERVESKAFCVNASLFLHH